MDLRAMSEDQKQVGLLRDDRGITAIFAAMAFAVLVAVVALAIDVGIWLTDKQSLQTAADQAVYSAMSGASAGGNGFTDAQAILSKAGYGCSTATSASNGSLTCTGANNLTIKINNPPSTGAYSGNSSAWEVILSMPEKKMFSSMVLSTPPTVTGRAVATMGGNVCFLALDTRSGDIHSFFGGTYANVNIDNCVIANNLLTNSATDSIDVKSGAVVNVSGIYMRTDTICDGGRCNGTLTSDTTPLAGQPAITDPYAARTIPAPSSTCDYTNLVVVGSATLDPGTYCGTNGNEALTISGSLSLTTSSKGAVTTLTFPSTTGVAVGMTVTDTTHTAGIPSGTTVTAVNGTTVTLSATTVGGKSGLTANDVISFASATNEVILNPGVYILDGQGGGACTGTSKPATCDSGDFLVTNGANVSGTGVTIVLTSSTSTKINIGNLYVTNGASLALDAPTSSVNGYPVSGVAIWQDKRAPNPTATDANHYTSTTVGVNYIDSGASTDINGVVYFPSQALSFSGGSGSAACTQVVAFVIVFNSSASVNYPANCVATAGVLSIGSTIKVVE